MFTHRIYLVIYMDRVACVLAEIYRKKKTDAFKLILYYTVLYYFILFFL